MRRTALTWILTLLLLPALAGVGFAGAAGEESTSAAATEAAADTLSEVDQALAYRSPGILCNAIVMSDATMKSVPGR